VQAYSNFISNPDSHYPPSCVGSPNLLDFANKKKFFEGELALISLRNMATGESPIGAETHNAHLAAFRVPCADSNRSMVLFEFNRVEGSDPRLFKAPLVQARTADDTEHWMSLARETNTWQVGIEPWASPQNFYTGACDWGCYDVDTIFVLDEGAPEGENPWQSSGLSVADYNGSFKVVFTGGDNSELVIDVPSSEEMFDSSPPFPLSGRLSGNWVVAGAADQGFLISVSELVGDDAGGPEDHLQSPLLMFLSWYTYDAEGNLLWLTGAAQFEQGATHVSVPIELVTNGEFLGTKVADRKVVGNVTLTGNNCNDLGFEYDLNDIALGSGTKRLKRLFSLETAGYTCRDLEARIEEFAK
jgi:hypothetical protein